MKTKGFHQKPQFQDLPQTLSGPKIHEYGNQALDQVLGMCRASQINKETPKIKKQYQPIL